MKNILAFLILSFFGLIQSTLVPLNLILVLVILYSVNLRIKEGFYWAFAGGVLRDILLGYPLGLGSAGLLSSVFLLGLYRRKFKERNIFYLLPFTLVSSVFLAVIFNEPIGVFSLVFLAVVFILLAPVIRIFFLRFEKEGEQLRLME